MSGMKRVLHGKSIVAALPIPHSLASEKPAELSFEDDVSFPSATWERGTGEDGWGTRTLRVAADF
jgi:hypothetical protein